MPPRRLAPAKPAAPLPRVIDPNAVYLADEFRAVFRLRVSTIRREVREGRLRIAKRAGRYYLLGEWILEWLQGGELPRRQVAADRNGEKINAVPAEQ